jgi:O-antigen/teichoic acid export membrane protein
MVLGHLLNGLGETKTIFKANLIGASTLIPLAPLFIILRGVPGLIVALLISSISTLAYQLFTTTKKFNLRIDAKSSLKIYLAALLSTIPLLIFLQLSPLMGLLNLLLGGAFYLATFLTIAPITTVVIKEDLINLRTILNHITLLHFLTELVFNYKEAILNLIKSKNSSKTCV